MKRVFCISIFFINVIMYGQVNVQWLQNTRGVSIAVDGQENVYTVDYDYNPAGDIYLTKRDNMGNFTWESKFDQTDNSNGKKLPGWLLTTLVIF